MTEPAKTAAQKVLTALYCNYDHEPTRRTTAAAALRAAADEVVPENLSQCETYTNEAIRLNQQGVRRKLLAIAAELENPQL
jgi:hypothetical protein